MSDAHKANMVAVSPEPDVVGDLQQHQQQVITVHDCPHMSIDDLLKIIKGANSMPLVLVPSRNGQLAAIAVDVHPNPVPVSGVEKKQEDFRAWLLLLTSLAATITYTAVLTPPGGFWPVDDKENGYVAGTSVMRDKFPIRYSVFHVTNTAAFFSSLMIIGRLAKNMYHKEPITMNNRPLVFLVGLCFLSLGISYIVGTWSTIIGMFYSVIVFGGIISYMMVTKN